jgi:hypothetical protein
MYQMIQMQDLISHPENSNRMAGHFMKKLEENIKKSGDYETITVSTRNLKAIFKYSTAATEWRFL